MNATSIKICDESEIDDIEACEFNIQGTRIMILRWQGELRAYINSCPHAGWPLNFQPNTFFNLDKTLIQCSNHMAMFEPGSGECISGPCIGSSLTAIPLSIKKGKVFVASASIPENTESAADYI